MTFRRFKRGFGGSVAGERVIANNSQSRPTQAEPREHATGRAGGQFHLFRWNACMWWQALCCGNDRVSSYLQHQRGQGLQDAYPGWTWAWVQPQGRTSWGPVAGRQRCWRSPRQAWSPPWPSPAPGGLHHCWKGSTWFCTDKKTTVKVLVAPATSTKHVIVGFGMFGKITVPLPQQITPYKHNLTSAAVAVSLRNVNRYFLTASHR